MNSQRGTVPMPNYYSSFYLSFSCFLLQHFMSKSKYVLLPVHNLLQKGTSLIREAILMQPGYLITEKIYSQAWPKPGQAISVTCSYYVAVTPRYLLCNKMYFLISR